MVTFQGILRERSTATPAEALGQPTVGLSERVDPYDRCRVRVKTGDRVPCAAARLCLSLRLPQRCPVPRLLYDVTRCLSSFILEVTLGPAQAPATLRHTFPRLRQGDYLLWLKIVNREVTHNALCLVGAALPPGTLSTLVPSSTVKNTVPITRSEEILESCPQRALDSQSL